MLSVGRSPCDGALLPNGSLISARIQPARYVFAMEFPRPVTRIVVPPLETPVPCRVHLAATTLKPCENLAEYRIRLFLPYILRSTALPGTTREEARRLPKRFLREAVDAVRSSHLGS